MIREAHGNLLRADVDALVNTVNTVGVMGKGIALQFKRAYPENFAAYEKACKTDQVKLGHVFVHTIGQMTRPYYILNFPTKAHWRAKSRIGDIQVGLSDLRRVIKELGIRSVAVPPLGCGNGGLEWSEVRPFIYQELGDLVDVEVLLYPPEGTPHASDMIVRTKRPRMTHDRAALILAFARYIALSTKADLSVDNKFSLIEAQKVAYFLQYAGWPLGIQFTPSYYGPYSQQIDQFISDVEGHFVIGYGDGSGGSKATLELREDAVEEARHTLADSPEISEVLARFESIVEGFEFPYGIELLSTVHYVAEHSKKAATISSVTDAISAWSERKRSLFKPAQAAAAFEHLVERKAVAV